VAPLATEAENATEMGHERSARNSSRLACLAVAGCVLVAYAMRVLVPAASHPDTNGFAAYYTISRLALLRSAEVWRAYDGVWFQGAIDAFGFHGVRDVMMTQPPTMALLVLPFAWASPAAARVAWIVVSVGSWVGGVALVSRSILGHGATARVLLVLAAVTTAYRPLRENFDRGQAYAVLFCLLTWSLMLLARGDRRAAWLAGIPLGGMLVLKSAGAWLVLTLVASRRWRTVAAVVATYIGVALVSLPLVGASSWTLFLERLPHVAAEPFRYVSAYQTVGGLLGHLFVFDPEWSPHPLLVAPRLATVATLAVMMVALVQSLRFGRGDDASLHERLLRLAIFDALIVTLAPIAEGYHYVLVLPAVMIAVWWAVRTRPGLASRAVLGVSLLLLTAPQSVYSNPAIQAGALALLAYPRVYGAFLLWGWLGHARGACDAASAPATADDALPAATPRGT